MGGSSRLRRNARSSGAPRASLTALPERDLVPTHPLQRETGYGDTAHFQMRSDIHRIRFGARRNVYTWSKDRETARDIALRDSKMKESDVER